MARLESQQPPHPEQADQPHHLRIPLALVIGRYFFYLLVGSLIVIGAPLAALTGQMRSGSIVPANYGEVHLDDVAETLSTQTTFNADAIPSAYRYALFTSTDSIASSDMNASQIEFARTVTASPNEKDAQVVVEQQWFFYTAINLPDGRRCVLCYNLTPQWVDKNLRDTLPNPQDMMFWSFGALAVLIVLIAMRASNVIKRKMNPLVEAAQAVGRQDLNTATGRSNVAQIDDVLRAMDEMRISLKQSLEAQWESEQRTREQVAALAHDLKTPLTVVRGNADMLIEDATAGALDIDQTQSAQAIQTAALSMDSFVSQIVEASHSGAGTLQFKPTNPSKLADQLEQEAKVLVEARGFTLDTARSSSFTDACCQTATSTDTRAQWDARALERAVLNLVDNACAYASHSVVRLVFSFDATVHTFFITVENDGSGFSPEALVHGTERFYRDDASRTGSHTTGNVESTHFGLGLAIASDIAHAHGGTLNLSNQLAGNGTIQGARATIVLPEIIKRDEHYGKSN